MGGIGVRSKVGRYVSFLYVVSFYVSQQTNTIHWKVLSIVIWYLFLKAPMSILGLLDIWQIYLRK
ncbi:hypothetical protein C8Q75DRAFT_756828 [Abortiporus biennis]|nr:hypothetical protein C8Q75DRAFT_756828 [Abortiporus biennis]